jgi:hypothetical protein
MIDFTRAFDSAWERMYIILFRPFDFGKWLAIGLSAFLAGFLQGGNGLNGSYNPNSYNLKSFHPPSLTINGVSTNAPPKFDFHQFGTSLSQSLAGIQAGLIILLAIVMFIFIFGLIFLLYWLGTRGQFMFLDNIVRNRGAISWPWHYYRRQANSLLLFLLLIFAVTMGVIIILGGLAALVGIPLLVQHRWASGGEIGIFSVLALCYVAFCIVFGFVFFIFREFGVPLMFRNGLLAIPAFWVTMNLLKQHTGSIVVFALLRMAIFIAVVIISFIICCATLCIGLLPYIGTVILLPVLVYVKCFTLDCLAQFGPQYDVWTVDVPPSTQASAPPPFSPPLPPG